MIKKKIILIVGILIAIILMVPIPFRLKDGGTVEYKAILYKISKVHSLTTIDEAEYVTGYKVGTVIEILGVKVFDAVCTVPAA